MGDVPSRLRFSRALPPAPHELLWETEVQILEPLGDELALVLWTVLRKLRAWLATAAADRAGLYLLNRRREALRRLWLACPPDPPLMEAFDVFDRLTRLPDQATGEELAAAAGKVVAWAEAAGRLQIAALFAEAAAALAPASPEVARAAARLCRRAAWNERAAVWYLRAYILAARGRNTNEVIRALLGAGNLFKDQGEHAEARRLYERAASRARQAKRRRLLGEAYHNLLCVAAEVGTYREADWHLRRALDYFPVSHPRLPVLVHDWAFLMVRLCHFTPAIAVLEKVSARVERPDLLILALGTLARATAGARRRPRFRAVERRLLDLVSEHEEHAAAALVNLAEGLRSLGEWSDAEKHALAALDLAERRQETFVATAAGKAIARIRARDTGPIEQPAPEPLRTERMVWRLGSLLSGWCDSDVPVREAARHERGPKPPAELG